MKRSRAYIINHSHESETVCSSAARISTTSGNALDIFQSSKNNEKNQKLIQKVLESGHKTIIEHSTYTIAFCDVSAVVEQFMIEFRLASFTVKSRRYVDFSNQGFLIPNYMNASEKNEYIHTAKYLFNAYNSLINLDVAKEDARFVLPYCFRSNFYCTVNARELLYILREMKEGRGSCIIELNQIADQLIKQLSEISPFLIPQLSFNSSSCNSFHKKQYGNIYTMTGQNAIELLNGSTKLLYYENDILNRLLRAYKFNNAIPDDTIFENKSTIWAITHQTRSRELEQVNITFSIKGLSLAGLTHLERHRMQSLMIPSLTNTSLNRFILPKPILNRSGAMSIYHDALRVAMEYRKELISRNNINQVYFCLGGSLLNIESTMNLHELQKFLALRCCNRAQWEIRNRADELLEQLRCICPDVFNLFGASCVLLNYCPEGRMTCGKPKNKIEEI